MLTTELAREREAIRHLISRSDAGDALTAYYALYHSPALTRLYVHRDGTGGAVAFVAACTTGADLFRPLVVMRAQAEEALPPLLRRALVAGRPYHLVVPPRYAAVIEREMDLTERRTGIILKLEPASFEPVLNVLVVPAPGADGGLRFEIRQGGRVMAAAGTNWRSPEWAEIYVYCEAEARGRGWGRAVVSACTAALLGEGVRPLYVAAEGDEASLRLAEGVGYRDTGQREFIAAGARRP